MQLHTWLAFFAASWLISLSPGAGAISCMSAGMRYGYRKSVWNILGLQAGILLLVVIVAMGLGAVLATSILAFNLIKWFGVAYLVYLGWKQWVAAPGEIAAGEGERPLGRPLTLVLRGFLVNASNPKAIIFILAVLPQFLDPKAPLLVQYLLMAATMVAVDLVVMAGYTGLAARVLRALRSPRQQRILNRTFGGLFVAAAALLATVRRTA